MIGSATDGGGKTKVLLVLTSSAGGAGEQAYQLSRDISHEEFDVTVAFGRGYPLDEEFERSGVRVLHPSLSRDLAPLTNVRGMWQLFRRMRRERYDVVCTSCSVAGFVGRIAATLAGVPTKVHIIQVYASRPFQPALRKRFFRGVEKLLDPMTTRYVAVSGAVKQYGVETGIMNAEKVDVIYNAAELREPSPDARERVRRDLDLDPTSQVVGTLGRFEPQKGLEYFLRAAAVIRAARPSTQFLIVGDGPLEDDLRALVRELDLEDAVRFSGWRRDVPDVLAALDVFCLASLWETFGIVLAEAMLAELPIVATAVDGIPEVVADGHTGFLVPPRDAAALAEKLLTLLDDPAQASRMGRAGRQRSLEKFSVASMVAGYERFLRALAAEATSAYASSSGSRTRRHV